MQRQITDIYRKEEKESVLNTGKKERISLISSFVHYETYSDDWCVECLFSILGSINQSL